MSQFQWSKADDSEEWNEFVRENGGSIFHSWAWRRTLEAAGLEPLYLVCRQPKDYVLAICPFFYTREGRHALVLESLPKGYVGGPLVRSGTDDLAPILESLQDSIGFSIFKPVTSLKIQVNRGPIADSLKKLGFSCRTYDDLFILDLHQTAPEQIWNQVFRKHERQAVKYYQQRRSLFGFAESEADYVDYLAFQKDFMQRFGGQPISSDFIAGLRVNLGNNFRVARTILENKLLAASLLMCDPMNSALHVGGINYSREKNIHSPVVHLNWEIVNWGLQNGFRYISFGRIPPKYHIKKKGEEIGGKVNEVYRFTIPLRNPPLSLARKISKPLQS